MLVTWKLDPAPVEVEEIRALGKGDWKVRVTKEVIEGCVQHAEERCETEGMNWDDVCWVEDGKRERMYEDLADGVRGVLLDVLRITGDESDEGYVSQ